MKVKTKRAIRVAHQRLVIPLARCEGCRQKVDAEPWPEGWQQTGISRWGTEYQKSGIAWWCPICARK